MASGSSGASWKCGSCGLINFAESASCRRCGTAMSNLAAHNSYPANTPSEGFPSQPQPAPYGLPPGHQQAPYPGPYNQQHNQQHNQQQSSGQQGYGQPAQGPQNWNAAPQNQDPAQQNWQKPQNWNYPQQPVNGWQQAPGNNGQPGQGYQPNSNYSSHPDYSQAPSYGAPSAGSYQPSLQMMNNWNQTGVWREGDKLVMHKHATLPDRCIKCNIPTNGSYLHRKLSWINPLWVLTILASWIIYLVIYYALRKTAEVTFGLCEQHKASRQTGMGIGWACALLGIGAFVFAIASEAFAFIFLGILLFLGGIIWASYAAAVVSVAKMDDQYIWLKRVDRDYLNSFPPTSGY